MANTRSGQFRWTSHTHLRQIGFRDVQGQKLLALGVSVAPTPTQEQDSSTFRKALETVGEVRLASCSESGVLDCSAVLAAQPTPKLGIETASAHQILFRKSSGSWTEFSNLETDEQILTDPVITSGWLALCLASKAATRVLIYSYAKGAKPVLRMEIGIEGRCNPRVRFDGLLLTIADDLGHLRAYELTYGEQIRDLAL